MAHFEILTEKLESIYMSSDYSVTEIANSIGIDKSTVSRILSGKTKKPSQEVIEKLATFFGVSKEEIMKSKHMSDEKNDYVTFDSVSDVIAFFMKEFNIFETIDFAKNCEISVSELTKILNNNKDKPSHQIAFKIANFIGINIDELLCEKPINRYKINALKENKSKKNIIYDIKKLDELLKIIAETKKDFGILSVSSACFFKKKNNAYGQILAFSCNFSELYDRILIGLIDNQPNIFELKKMRNKANIYFPHTDKMRKKEKHDVVFIGKLAEIKF